MLRRLSLTFTLVALSLLFSPGGWSAMRKPTVPDKFPPNPLEINVSDPLLPQGNQPLTPQERVTLEAAVNDLNQQATAKLAAGDKGGAFEIWNREIRLRRALGTLAEVQALGRVGDVAYRENERLQVQYVTQRLQTIQKQTQSQSSQDMELWGALAQGFRQVRSPKSALEAYNQILTTVRQQQNATAEVETLQNIAAVHLSWFDYPQAAVAYEELLKLAQAKGDSVNEKVYLVELAYIYTQGKQPQESVRVRNKLVQMYVNQEDAVKLPPLKMAIASDYETLAKSNPDLLSEAFKNYQEAYTSAWSLQQYTLAGDALQKLIALYRTQGQLEDAIKTTEILINTQQLATNFYGLMKAYDQKAQLHLERKDYPQALTALQKGLEIAQQLKTDEAYFNEQITKLNQLPSQ